MTTERLRPETRPMTDLEYRLWQERGLAHAQLLAIASVLGGDDKGETRDHARWTPALDAARNLIAERDALREGVAGFEAHEAHEERDAAVNSLRALVNQVEKSINTRTCPVTLLRSLNDSRVLLSQLDRSHDKDQRDGS